VTVIRQHACAFAVLCTMSCTRTGADVRPTDPEVGPPSSSAAPPVSTASADAVETGTSPQDAGSACRRLPLNVGGTVERQSFEGRVGLATGHDPEQGDGTFPVLELDVPVCSAYELAPQREVLVGVLGGKAKWDAFAARWKGQRVRLTGDVRSMDIYVRPLRHFLLFVSQAEALP
jgi:hypothetical protein